MSNQNDYQEKLSEIQKIKNDEVKTPSIPVDAYLQEAEYLYQWATEDFDELQKAGLGKDMLEDLPKRAGACREAQSLWFNDQHSKEQAEKEWKIRSVEAYDLRDETLHAFRYAFRNNKRLLTNVAEISEGTGHADMIQDLNDLAVLGSDNKEILKKINYNLDKLEVLAKQADELAELLARTNGERQKDNVTLVIRNKAYTYLKEAIDEIRACGKYVFWKNPDRLKGYRSDYIRKSNQKHNN